MTKKDITSFLTERKHRASSYPPLNQNTVKCILTNSASLFRVKGELTGCKASFPFATLLLRAEQAVADLGLSPQLGQTGLNGIMTVCATEDRALSSSSGNI